MARQRRTDVLWLAPDNQVREKKSLETDGDEDFAYFLYYQRNKSTPTPTRTVAYKLWSDSEGDLWHWQNCNTLLDEVVKDLDCPAYDVFLGDALDHGPSTKMAEVIKEKFCLEKCKVFILGNRDLNKIRLLKEMRTWSQGTTPTITSGDPWAIYNTILSNLNTVASATYNADGRSQLLKLCMMADMTMGTPSFTGGLVKAFLQKVGVQSSDDINTLVREYYQAARQMKEVVEKLPSQAQRPRSDLNSDLEEANGFLREATVDKVRKALEEQIRETEAYIKEVDGSIASLSETFIGLDENASLTRIHKAHKLHLAKIHTTVLAFATDSVIPMLKRGRLVHVATHGENEFVCFMHSGFKGIVHDVKKMESILGRYPESLTKEGIVRWGVLDVDLDRTPNQHLTGNGLLTWAERLNCYFSDTLLPQALAWAQGNHPPSHGQAYEERYHIVASLAGVYNPAIMTGPAAGSAGKDRLQVPEGVDPSVKVAWACGHVPRAFVEVARNGTGTQTIVRMDTQHARPSICASIVTDGEVEAFGEYKSCLPNRKKEGAPGYTTSEGPNLDKLIERDNIVVTKTDDDGRIKTLFQLSTDDIKDMYVGPILCVRTGDKDDEKQAVRCIVSKTCEQNVQFAILVDHQAFEQWAEGVYKTGESLRLDTVSFGRIFYTTVQPDQYVQVPGIIRTDSNGRSDTKWKTQRDIDMTCDSVDSFKTEGDLCAIKFEDGVRRKIFLSRYVSSTRNDPYVGMPITQQEIETLLKGPTQGSTSM